MKNSQIRIILVLVLLFGVAINTQAAVTDLYFGYGKTTVPSSIPTTWAQWTCPECISYEYQLHQESFNFNSGEYVCFQIGLGNIDLAGSVFIDKIELTGPSGSVPIFNSGFENGTSGWSAWGSYNVEGDFSISSEAYEGSSAAKLTVSSSGRYSIHGQVPVPITESGDYTLSVYTKVYEAEREIPPDEIFAMEIGNRWIYDSSIEREIINIDSTTFDRDTFEMTISENGIQIGKEWYEVWKGYVRYWGIYDAGMYQFDFGLLAAWFPVNVSDHKESLAWVLGFNTKVDLAVDFLGIEAVTLHFDTLEAYRFRYNLKISGPGGTAVESYDQWILPYIGVIKQQTAEGVENLVSFAIRGGTSTEDTDTDSDGLKDYQELAVYITDPDDPDTDGDQLPDGWEVDYGLDPLSSLPPNGTTDDPDGDDLTNLEEYNLGRHPNNWEPDTPVLSSPEDGAIDVALTPELTIKEFEDHDGDVHAATDWQISTDNVNFLDNLVLDIRCDKHLTSLTVPEFILTVSDVVSPYYWRARFHDDRDAKSEWSEVSSFTTIDVLASDDTNQNGVPDEQEITDDTVDLDEDGTADILQGDMKCANTVVGDAQVAVKQGTNVTSVDSINSIDPATIADTENKPDGMPLGLICFKLTVDNPGDIAQVTVYLSEPAPSGAKWYKHDPVNGWQDYSADATFSGDRRSVTLELQDGDYGDCDGAANGYIVDPSGPGVVAAPPPPPAGGGGGGGCFISSAGELAE
jgi:hypothetical protein